MSTGGPIEHRVHVPTRGRGIFQQIFEQRSTTEQAWTILPNGQVNLIFQLDSDAHLTRALTLAGPVDPLRHASFLSGLHTKPLELRFSRIHVMGAAMSPVAVRALFGMPAREVRDGAVEMGLLRPALGEIEGRLRDLATFEQRARYLERALLGLVQESSELHLALRMERAAEALAARIPPGRDTGLAARLGYSRTHAHRLANEWYGASLGASQRLRQFVHAVHALHRAPASLTAAAHEAGYYDQPHFNRAFREFADITPGEYRRRMTALPGQLAD